jgi:hypothetical protein
MAFHWFVEPSVAKNRAAVPYQPPPVAMMPIPAAPAAAPVARPAPPARLAATSATPTTDALATSEPADKPAETAPKKPARQPAERTTARHEQPARVWNPVGAPNGW